MVPIFSSPRWQCAFFARAIAMIVIASFLCVANRSYSDTVIYYTPETSRDSKTVYMLASSSSSNAAQSGSKSDKELKAEIEEEIRAELVKESSRENMLTGSSKNIMPINKVLTPGDKYASEEVARSILADMLIILETIRESKDSVTYKAVLGSSYSCQVEMERYEFEGTSQWVADDVRCNWIKTDK